MLARGIATRAMGYGHVTNAHKSAKKAACDLISLKTTQNEMLYFVQAPGTVKVINIQLKTPSFQNEYWNDELT
jgi:hypothetical protein